MAQIRSGRERERAPGGYSGQRGGAIAGVRRPDDFVRQTEK